MKPPLQIGLIALLASAHLAIATPRTGAAFATALDTRIGDKQGAAAYNAAAGLVEVTLRDRSHKRHAPSYIRAAIGALQPLVKGNEIVMSRSALARALVNGYFKNRRPNPDDHKFLLAAKALFRRLPSSQRTATTVALISSPIYQYFRRHPTPDGA
jgi:hypothetical protein